MTAIDSVWGAIQRYHLLPSGTRVVIAVSGGADSVALLHLLLELAPKGEFTVAGLAHVNHQLRGAESDRDEAFCGELGIALRLPVCVERIVLDRTVLPRGGRSIEAAARQARYDALERARQVLGADLVAVGHTRDDQAETVLLKLMRGAGARGLAGIYPRKDRVIRPLIDTGRKQVRAWLADKKIAHVEDRTNADVANPRNLLRHEVLPALERWFGPSVPLVLARTAEIARADEELLAALARTHTTSAVGNEGGRLTIRGRTTAEAPLAIRRRVLREILRAAGVPHAGFGEIEAVRAFLEGHGRRLELGGRIRLDRNGEDVVLTKKEVTRPEIRPFRYALPVPGHIWVAEAGASVTAAPGEVTIDPGDIASTAIAAPRAGAGLWVRNWQAGDSMRPVGLGGSKKLQDLFVDRKVPRAARHSLPLVVDRNDRVIWVPGHALDESGRVTGRDGVVVLKLTRKLGGPE